MNGGMVGDWSSQGSGVGGAMVDSYLLLSSYVENAFIGLCMLVCTLKRRDD